MDFPIKQAQGVLGLTALLLCACGPGIPLPKTGPHQGSQTVEVPYPPPPPKPAIVRMEERPSPEAVWVDGQWEWQKGLWAWQPGAWVWEPGGWVVPSPESYYAYPSLARTPEGKLMWRAGRFYRQLPKPGAKE